MRDGRREPPGVGVVGAGSAYVHRREPVRLVAVGQQPGHRVVAGGLDRQPQVQQRCTAADVQLPAGRVEHAELPAAVGVEIDPVTVAHPETPRLRVVDARGLHGRGERTLDDLCHVRLRSGHLPFLPLSEGIALSARPP